jgi:hypothetical protein
LSGLTTEDLDEGLMPLGLFNVFPSPWPYTILMKLAVFCSYFRLVYGRYAQESVNFVNEKS